MHAVPLHVQHHLRNNPAVQVASGALQTLLVVLSGLHLVTVAALCPRLRLALIVSVAAAELLLPE